MGDDGAASGVETFADELSAVSFCGSVGAGTVSIEIDSASEEVLSDGGSAVSRDPAALSGLRKHVVSVQRRSFGGDRADVCGTSEDVGSSIDERLDFDDVKGFDSVIDRKSEMDDRSS